MMVRSWRCGERGGGVLENLGSEGVQPDSEVKACLLYCPVLSCPVLSAVRCPSNRRHPTHQKRTTCTLSELNLRGCMPPAGCVHTRLYLHSSILSICASSLSLPYHLIFPSIAIQAFIHNSWSLTPTPRLPSNSQALANRRVILPARGKAK